MPLKHSQPFTSILLGILFFVPLFSSPDVSVPIMYYKLITYVAFTLGMVGRRDLPKWLFKKSAFMSHLYKSLNHRCEHESEINKYE